MDCDNELGDCDNIQVDGENMEVTYNELNNKGIAINGEKRRSISMNLNAMESWSKMIE